MKNIFFIVALLIFNLGLAQNSFENFTASIDADEFVEFDAPSFDIKDLDDVFGINANMKLGEVVFNAPGKVDYINIYNSDSQEIFSAKGTALENGKLDVSYLPEGTYYIEVVIGKDMGTHKIIKK